MTSAECNFLFGTWTLPVFCTVLCVSRYAISHRVRLRVYIVRGMYESKHCFGELSRERGTGDVGWGEGGRGGGAKATKIQWLMFVS